MITIVPAEPSDLELIMELERTGFAPGQERWSVESWRSELTAADRDVLLGRLDDDAGTDGQARSVGVITVQTIEQVCDLHRLVVHPSARRRGVGTALIAAGVSAARERGAVQMMLEVRWDNDAAIAAYQWFGFEQLGSRRDYYGPGRDALIMKLYDLSGSST